VRGTSFWLQNDDYFKQLEPLVAALRDAVPEAKYDAKQLVFLLVQLLHFQEAALGKEVSCFDDKVHMGQVGSQDTHGVKAGVEVRQGWQLQGLQQATAAVCDSGYGRSAVSAAAVLVVLPVMHATIYNVKLSLTMSRQQLVVQTSRGSTVIRHQQHHHQHQPA
jgi:hypothetical protein